MHREGGSQRGPEGDLPQERHGELLPPGGDRVRTLFFFFLAGEPLPGFFSMSHTQLLTHPSSPITQASSGDTRYHDCSVSRERFQRTSTPKLTPMSFSHSAQKQVHSLTHHWVHVIFNAIWHTCVKKSQESQQQEEGPRTPSRDCFFLSLHKHMLPEENHPQC